MTRACDKLHPFADGELPIDEVSAFERHLVVCATCQEELKTVMMLEALSYGLSAEPPDAAGERERERERELPGPAGPSAASGGAGGRGAEVAELPTRRH